MSTARDREARMILAFVTLADTFVKDYDVVDLLDVLVDRSMELSAAQGAGILLGDTHDDLRMVSSSGEDATTMELLALGAGDSPCRQCHRTASAVAVPDIEAVAPRWPEFAAATKRAGSFRSMHALPLRLRERGRAIGVLSLFRCEPGPLPDDDLAVAQALADVATIGIESERAIHRGNVVSAQLQRALDSRVVIEQAKGVVAHHTGHDMDSAFTLLRDHSRRHRVRLVDLARAIASHELDPAVLATG